MERDVPHDVPQIWRRVLPVWAGLTVLLLLTLGLAYVPMGRFNTPIGLLIALAKALLVAVFFMNLRRPDPLLRLTAAATSLWLFFMFALTLADFLTRLPDTQPGTITPRSYETVGTTTGHRAFR